MEIVSFIIAISALAISFIPVIGLFGIIVALVSFILGIVSLATMKSRGKTKKILPITSILLSIISTILSIVMFVVYIFSGTIAINDFLNEHSYLLDNLGEQLEEDINKYLEQSLDISKYKEYEIGDRITLGEEYILVVKDVTISQGNETFKPSDDQHEFLLVNIDITNIDDESHYVNKYDFWIKNNHDSRIAVYDISHKLATFESKNLNTAENITGIICFEKEKNSDNYYLTFDHYKIKVNLDL